MFRGHYTHTVDDKGRVAIPARFREALAASPDRWGDVGRWRDGDGAVGSRRLAEVGGTGEGGGARWNPGVRGAANGERDGHRAGGRGPRAGDVGWGGGVAAPPAGCL